jgi:signal peptidase I
MKHPPRSKTSEAPSRRHGETGTGREGRSRRERRESVESFVVVLVAFLVWSIEAEGFVIPTGSMAPTLLGRHKEIVCPECGHVYSVNADSEVDSSSGASTGIRVAWGTCENCRFETRVDDAPSASGDRIYTMKRGLAIPFLPAIGEVGPGRWEIAVFKLPEEPEVRYIKRQVGLPGETIRIKRGDLWRRSKAAKPFERLRRPFAHQQAMQVLVYDDAHRAASLRDDLRWRRWMPRGPGWSEPEAGTFVSSPAEPGWTELGYGHLVPEPEQWEAVRRGEPLPTPRPTLITDFSSNNTDLSPQGRLHPRLAARPWFQPHWVGDLTLSCQVTVRKPAGRLRVELIKEGRSCRCEIDLVTGRGTLFREAEQLGESVATPLGRPGDHSLTLANVDDRLTLQVDGQLPFGEGCENSSSASGYGPTASDLRPARIGSKGAEVEVKGLVLLRDVYYTLAPGETDYEGLGSIWQAGPHALFDLLADPGRYADLGSPPAHDYPLGEGRYLMLGDNSPWSRDGRAWGRIDQSEPGERERGWDSSGRESWEVPESLIIGKAFCVYWPHLKPIWPMFRLGADYRLPVRPYIERIRWIR